MTPLLTQLIIETSLPLKTVESNFAVDSTCFTTSRFVRWYDVKWGKVREQHHWVKVQAMTEVKTNIITSVEICDGDGADSPFLPSLVRVTAKNFKIAEVSADKGYSSVENHEVIDSIGAVPFIPFKKNATSGSGGLWQKFFHYFSFRRADFL